MLKKEVLSIKFNSVYLEVNGESLYTLSKSCNNMAQFQIMMESAKQST